MYSRFMIALSVSLVLGGVSHIAKSLAAEAKEGPRDQGAPPVRKDVFGDPLPNNAVARLGTNRLRKDQGTASVAYSSDGKWIASADTRGAVRIWNAAGGEEIALVYSPFYPELVINQCVRFSPDGRHLVYSTPHGLQLWETATRRSSPLPVDVKPFVFSPDGRLLAGIENQKLIIFDFKKRTVRSHPCGSNKKHWAITFSPDGKLIATGEEGNTPSTTITRLWDIAADKEIAKWQSSQGWIDSLDFSPDGKLLASGGHYSFCLWDLASHKRVASVAFSASIVSFSPDGKLLAVTNSSDTVRLWNVKRVRNLSTALREVGYSDTITALMEESIRHKKVGSIRTGNGGITTAAFSPDGKRLLIGGCDYALRLWDVETGEEVLARAGHRYPIHSVQFSPNGQTLVSRGEDLSILLWDFTTGKVRQLFSWEEKDRRRAPWINYRSPNTLAYAPDGKTIAAITADYDLWDATSGYEKLTIHKPKYRSSAIAFSPDGQVLAVVDDSICIWSASSGAELQSSRIGGSDFVAFSPDGRTLAMPGLGSREPPASGSLISLWDWRTNRLLRSFQTPKGWPCYLTFSFDGQLLATCGGDLRQKDGLVHLWETATGNCFRTLDHKKTSVWCIALSPDGRLLASGGERDRTVHIWDIFTGKELAQLKGHRGNICSVAFSLDGKLLASGSADTTILLWDVSSLQPKLPAIKAVPKEFNRLWTEMKGGSVTAYQAMWTLNGAGDKAVAFLKQRLRPVPLPDVKQLIADLDSEKFRTREAATTQLAQLGEYAKPAMRQALQAKPTLEVRKRLKDLLARIPPLPPCWGEGEIREVRAVHVLEHIGSPAARHLLKKLAGGAPGAVLTRNAKLALQRLERHAKKP